MKIFDFLVIGAGIMGLTVARELKKRHPTSAIIILEKESAIGKHASGRNSGVLHTGIYYEGESLKAKLCAKGAELMRVFATEHEIPFKKSGKVIISTSQADGPTIEKLLDNAFKNAVTVEKVDAKQIREIEPSAYRELGGIWCPETAVIDSNTVLKKLQFLLESSGVVFDFNAKICGINTREMVVRTTNHTYKYGVLFNCAGSHADKIAKCFGLAEQYELLPFKGIYYKLDIKSNVNVNGNIYPVPDIDLPFLGIHFTRTIDNSVYVGPTAMPAFGRENYGIFSGLNISDCLGITANLATIYLANHDNFRRQTHKELSHCSKQQFCKAASKLVYGLSDKDLVPPKKVGIRPQLVNLEKRKLVTDFVIEKTENSVHILNSISPAFTSSLAFSRKILDVAEL